MQITDVRLRKKSNPDSRVKAVASVTFDNEFVVHDIKVKSKVVEGEGEDKLFISMPRKKTLSGEFKDIAHPINPATREKIQKAILQPLDFFLLVFRYVLRQFQYLKLIKFVYFAL